MFLSARIAVCASACMIPVDLKPKTCEISRPHLGARQPRGYSQLTNPPYRMLATCKRRPNGTAKECSDVKKFKLLTVAVASLGLFVATATLSAQEAAAPSSPSSPHQIALIDMAFIFKNYDKFKDQTASLQKAAEDAEAEAQKMMEQGKQLQQQLQTMQAGSPDYTKLESELIGLKNKLETFRQIEQQKIVRQQADVYKTIYLEVQDVVRRYATHYDYSLVMRFSREEVSASTNPQAILQSMNRQVVHYQPQDDITEPILSYLNDNYKKTASAK